MGRSTPGPWRAYASNGVVAVHKGAKPVVAWPGFDSADVGGNAVNIPNAFLIAAAPELLNACRTALDLGVDTEAAKVIRAAIKKAEGR